MRAFVVFLVCASLTFWRGNCYVDNCRSLNVDRLRTQTKNLTLNYSTEEAIDDKFRFSRSVEEDGFVQYVSPFGFESVTIFGYAYSPDTGDTDWQLELRVAPSPFAKVTTVYVLNRTNLSQHEQALIPSNDVPTNWRKFKFSYDLQCPKVVEIWLRGRASGNATPGWGLQVGKVKLDESLLESCTIPSCLQNTSEQCFNELASIELTQIEDPMINFSKVFLASANMEVDTDNAISYFNGDAGRLHRTTEEKGIVVYHIPEGIASIEITLFRCGNVRTTFSVTPYLDPSCKPLKIPPQLKYDSYLSNCWRRFVATVDFKSILDCPPTYVELVIEGSDINAIQIANVALTGYGSVVQDPEFVASLGPIPVPVQDPEDIENVLGTAELNSEDEGSSESIKMKHWLPATIIACLVLFLIIAGILAFRNEEIRDFVADYIEDNFPSIYGCFFPPEPPPKTPTRTPPTGAKPPSNLPFSSESINFSCTFDANLKKSREPMSVRDVTATRDGLGAQLIDLSKHLQKDFWASKMGRKHKPLQIEERIGKGGFGKVWRARWQGTPVAVKVVPLYANLRQEEKQARMAIMEAALSGCLAHPNIVSTYVCEIREANDFDNNDDHRTVEDSQTKQKWVSIDRFANSYASKNFMKSQTKNDLEVRIIMEYCDRGSLVAAIRRGWFRNPENPSQPDLDAIVLTALDIARGLYCLHENNIIHGDLKPHNVLLQNKPFVDSRGFIAKIADFGLSIKMESEQSHVDGMRMGTGGYVSPEVAVRGKILPASDIYSFGILLWEMYTGELIQDVLKDAPKVSSRLTMGSWRPVFTDDCPKEYSRLACMCWNDFPDWRPTLEYIIDELNQMLQPEESQPARVETHEDLEDTSAPTMTLP